MDAIFNNQPLMFAIGVLLLLLGFAIAPKSKEPPQSFEQQIELMRKSWWEPLMEPALRNGPYLVFLLWLALAMSGT